MHARALPGIYVLPTPTDIRDALLLDYIFNPASLSTPGDREKAKARKASERVEDRKLPPAPPPATSFSAAPPPPAPAVSACVPAAFSLLLAHPPPPEQRPPPFLFLSSSRRFLLCRPLGEPGDPASGAAPRRILYFRIPDGITMQEISFVIYARERAGAPLQTSTFSLRLIKLPGGLCILNRRPARHLYASRALPTSLYRYIITAAVSRHSEARRAEIFSPTTSPLRLFLL